MPAQELITLTPVAFTSGGRGEKVKSLGTPVEVYAIPEDAPEISALEEATAVFNYDTEFQVRRLPSLEAVDSKWELTARGVRWTIRRARFFARNGGRERWIGIQAVRPS